MPKHNRPKWGLVWAQDTPPENIGDPDVYVPTLPDYPEQVENQYATGWFVSPKAVVKQPQEWSNFWYNSVDQIIKAQIFAWAAYSEAITYKHDAIYFDVGNLYIVGPNAGEKFLSFASNMSASEWLGYLQEMQNATKAHFEDYNNPHDTTWEDFGGMSRATIDQSLNFIWGGINGHEIQTNNPHKVTWQQLDILPKEGGVHTGQVSFRSIRMASGVFDRTDGVVGITIGNNTFGLDCSNQTARLNKSLMVSMENFFDMKRVANRIFMVPEPMLWMPMMHDIHPRLALIHGNSYDVDYLESGNSVNPKFARGLVIDKSGISIWFDDVYVSAGTVTYLLDVDGVPSWRNAQGIKQWDLGSYVGRKLTNLRIYDKVLSAYQIAAMGAGVFVPTAELLPLMDQDLGELP